MFNFAIFCGLILIAYFRGLLVLCLWVLDTALVGCFEFGIALMFGVLVDFALWIDLLVGAGVGVFGLGCLVVGFC